MVEPLFIVYYEQDSYMPPSENEVIPTYRPRYYLVKNGEEWRWVSGLAIRSGQVKPLTIGEIKEYLISKFGFSDGMSYAPQFVKDHGILANRDKLRPEQYLWLVNKGYVWS